MNKHDKNMKNAATVEGRGTAEFAESRRGLEWIVRKAQTQTCTSMGNLNAKAQRFAKQMQSQAGVFAMGKTAESDESTSPEYRREFKATIGKSKKAKQNTAPQNCYPLPSLRRASAATCHPKPMQLSTLQSPLSTQKVPNPSSFIQSSNSNLCTLHAELSSFILHLSSLRALTLTLALTLALSLSLQAQDVPTPKPAHKGLILLENATLHLGDGTVLEKANLLIEDDKIKAVGILDVHAEAGLERIDLTGKHVYPGMIAPITQLGLSEIEAARATDDRSEVGPVNPNVRAIISYNTDSRVTPTVRSNGILLAQVTPEGGLLKGLSSVVQLDAWSWEDAAYLTDDAMHLEWPSQQIIVYPGAPPREEQEKRLKDRMQLLENAMREAKAYATAKAANKVAQIDLRWEAMVPVVNRQKSIWIYADAEKDIRTAIEFGQRHNLRMVLVGGADAWLLSDMLRQYQIPVVLGKPHSLPRTEDDAVDQPFNNARILYKAGVLTCLSMDNFWNYRNLPFQAGQAVAAGLTKEEALQLVTANTAKILGIDARTGTLAEGKDANIIVSTGDLLDMRSSNIELAFIQGRQIDLGNKQKDLNAKFSGKYGK